VYWVIWLGIGILCLVIQTVCSDILTIYGIKPNFLLVIIIFFAFRHSVFESGIMGFVLGILEDSLSGSTFGINGFTKLIIGLVVSTIKKVYTENLISILLSIFVFTVIQSLLIFVLQSICGISVDTPTMNRTILIAIYNTIIGIFIFSIAHKIELGEE